jgi:sulfur-oxidizing protein SoxZ
MFTPIPRVQIPDTAVKDDIIIVKALIAHPMESGFRRDNAGALIPRFIINKFTCSAKDMVLFSVDLHEAMAANPYIEFYLRATESGQLTFEWHEDGGAVFQLQHELTVT